MDKKDKVCYYIAGDIMNNKKIALIVVIFIAVFLIIAGIIGIFEHIPILGKPIAFILVIILVLLVTGFFVMIAKRRKG